MENKDIMLDSAIKDAFEKLRKMQAGTDEYLQQTKAIATLYDLDLKESTGTCDANHQEDQIEIEKEKLKIEKEKLKMEKEQNEAENSLLKKIPWNVVSATIAGGFSLVGLWATEKMQFDGKLIKLSPFQIKPKV